MLPGTTEDIWLYCLNTYTRYVANSAIWTWLYRFRFRILFLSLRWMASRFLPGRTKDILPPYGVEHFFGDFRRIWVWWTALKHSKYGSRPIQFGSDLLCSTWLLRRSSQATVWQNCWPLVLHIDWNQKRRRKIYAPRIRSNPDRLFSGIFVHFFERTGPRLVWKLFRFRWETSTKIPNKQSDLKIDFNMQVISTGLSCHMVAQAKILVIPSAAPAESLKTCSYWFLNFWIVFEKRCFGEWPDESWFQFAACSTAERRGLFHGFTQAHRYCLVSQALVVVYF